MPVHQDSRQICGNPRVAQNFVEWPLRQGSNLHVSNYPFNGFGGRGDTERLTGAVRLFRCRIAGDQTLQWPALLCPAFMLDPQIPELQVNKGAVTVLPLVASLFFLRGCRVIRDSYWAPRQNVDTNDTQSGGARITGLEIEKQLQETAFHHHWIHILQQHACILNPCRTMGLATLFKPLKCVSPSAATGLIEGTAS